MIVGYIVICVFIDFWGGNGIVFLLVVFISVIVVVLGNW